MLMRFSPHTRGCSPTQPDPTPDTPSFPRIRGDVPMSSGRSLVGITFSPHTRGCSVKLYEVSVVPIGFPRIRGDVPETSMAEKILP